MPYAYGTRGMQGAINSSPAPKGMGEFPIVGGGLGGLPVRRVANASYPNYRQDVGCGVPRNITGATEYWYYRKTTDFQLTTDAQVVETYTGVGGVTMRGAESADGLHLWVLRYDGGTFQCRATKYSRPDLNSVWTFNAFITTNYANPTDVLVSANGDYCLLGCAGADGPFKSAILWQYEAGAITQKRIWQQGVSTSSYPIAAMTDITTGRFYCLVGGVSTAQDPSNVTRPELGYIKNGTWSTIAADNALTAVVGSVGINCRFGFLNTKLGFLHITTNAKAVREFSFDDAGVALVGTILTHATCQSDNNGPISNGIQVSPRDDYFCWCGSYTEGTLRVVFGYKNAAGSWVEYDNASMAVSAVASQTVSPMESHFADYTGSSARIRTFSYSPATGITVGSSIATLANGQWLRFSTGVAAALKRTP